MPTHSRKRKAKRMKMDKEDATVELPQPEREQEKFENLFHNEGTRRAAFDMFHKQLKSLSKNPHFDEPVVVRRGRSAAAAVSKEHGEGTGGGCDDHEGREDSAEAKGFAAVNDLLDRFTAGKKAFKKRQRAAAKKAAGGRNLEKLKGYDSSDDEFLLLEDELGLNDSEDGSDFLRFTVPQYDLKVKLLETHSNVIKKMAEAEVATLCRAILPDLEDILFERIPSERHETFKKCGISKQPLRDVTITEPFSARQDMLVGDLILKKVTSMNQGDYNGEMCHYITHVLLPEALIRIFAKANSIDFEQAEKELLYKARYDGKLSEDLLQTINVTAEDEQPKI